MIPHALRLCAGIGRATDLESMTKMASRPDAAQRWRRATALIIDEVRMPDQDSRGCLLLIVLLSSGHA